MTKFARLIGLGFSFKSASRSTRAAEQPDRPRRLWCEDLERRQYLSTTLDSRDAVPLAAASVVNRIIDPAVTDPVPGPTPFVGRRVAVSTVDSANGNRSAAVAVTSVYDKTIGGVRVSGRVTGGAENKNGPLTLANPVVSLAGGLLTVTAEKASLRSDGTNVTGSFIGTVKLAGTVTGLGITGVVTVTISKKAVTVSGTGVTLAAAGSSFTGDFGFMPDDATTVAVTATNVVEFVSGSDKKIGLDVSGSLGLLIESGTKAATYALAASGIAATHGVAGLIAGGNVTTTASNLTGKSVLRVTAGGQTYTVGAGTLFTAGGLTLAVKDGNKDALAVAADGAIVPGSTGLTFKDNDVILGLAPGGVAAVAVRGTATMTLNNDGFGIAGGAFAVKSVALLGKAYTGSVGTGKLAALVAAAKTPAGPTTVDSLPDSPDAPKNATASDLGPLTLDDLGAFVGGVSYGDRKLQATVGLSAGYVAIKTGQSEAGVTAELEDVKGAFTLRATVDATTNRIKSYDGTGKFAFTAGRAVVDAPGAINIEATGLTLGYDPQGGVGQRLFGADSATVTVPLGTKPTGGKTYLQVAASGLAVYGDHFSLGDATLTYVGTVKLGSVLNITDPYVTLNGLSVPFTAGELKLNNQLTIGAESMSLGTGSIAVTGTGVSSTITVSGKKSTVAFAAATLEADAGPITFSGSNITLDPFAIGNAKATVFSFKSLGAEVTIKNVKISAKAGALDNETIKITGDGKLSAPSSLFISATLNTGDAGDVGVPSFLPFDLNGSVLLKWDDFANDPKVFTIDLSAETSTNRKVFGKIALGGSVTHLVIDTGKLLAGSFPITSIEQGTITAKGDVFGGKLDAGLLVGVVSVDDKGRSVPSTSSKVDHRVFYAGIDGSFDFASAAGLTLRFGLTQNGPLAASVQYRGNIELFPPADIALKSLYGGVEFDAPQLPEVHSPEDLKNAAFTPGVELTPDQWLKRLQRQAVNNASGGAGGYLFTLPEDKFDVPAGDVRGSSQLAKYFDAQSYPLTVRAEQKSLGIGGGRLYNEDTKTTVTPVGDGDDAYILQDANTRYLLTRNDVGDLEVSQYRVTLSRATDPDVDTEAAFEELKSLQIGDAVRSVFADIGIPLEGNAAVQKLAKNAGYGVVDGNYVYKFDDIDGVLVASASRVREGSVFDQPMRIEVAATLGFGGVPTDSASITADLAVMTTGQVLFDADAVFGVTPEQIKVGDLGLTEHMNFRAYLDLRDVNDPNPNAKAYFLYEQYADVFGYRVLQISAGGSAYFGSINKKGEVIVPASTDKTPVPGFGVKLDGAVMLQPIPDLAFTIKGGSSFVYNSATDQFTVGFSGGLSVNIADLIRVDNVVTAAGKITFEDKDSFKMWGAAQLRFNGETIPMLDEAGITANAALFLRLNTDLAGHDVTIDQPKAGDPNGKTTPTTLHLAPVSAGLYAVGSLGLKKGPVDAVLTGLFDMQLNLDDPFTDPALRFSVFAAATLSLRVSGASIVSFSALGVLLIDGDGVAAELDVSLNTLDNDIAFADADFKLFLNTTGDDKTLHLDAAFVKLVDEVQPAGKDVLASLPGAAAGVDEDGNKTYSLTVHGGAPLYKLGDNGRPQFTGYAAKSEYLVVNGYAKVSFLSAITLQGSFAFTQAADHVRLEADARATLGGLISGAAFGTLDVSKDGVYGALSAAFASGVQLASVATIYGGASLLFNTTDTDQSLKVADYDPDTGRFSTTPRTVTSKAHTVNVDLSGRLKLASVVDVRGRFTLDVSENEIDGTFDAHASILNGRVDLRGGFVASDGKVALYANGYLSIGSADTFQLAGYATLTVNTFGAPTAVTVPDEDGPYSYTVANDGKFKLDFYGTVHVASIELAAFSATIRENKYGILEAQGQSTANVGLGTAAGFGYVSSTGAFAFGAIIDVGTSGTFAGIGYGASFRGKVLVSYLTDEPTLLRYRRADGSTFYRMNVATDTGAEKYFRAAGSFVASAHYGRASVGAGGSASFDQRDGRFHVNLYVDLYVTTIDVQSDLQLKIYSKDPAIPSTVAFNSSIGDYTEAAVIRPSDLVIGGVRPNYKNVVVRVSAVPNTYTADGHQDIVVNVNGYSEKLTNRSYLDIGSGAQSVTIDADVRLPVRAKTGLADGYSGGVIRDYGSGPATLLGGGGKDTFVTGSGATSVYGNGNGDTVTLGAGNTSVFTSGSTRSTAYWNGDTSGQLVWYTTGKNDQLVAAFDGSNGHGGGEAIDVNTTISNSHARIGGSPRSNRATTYAYTDVPNLLINAPTTASTVTLHDLARTKLTSFIMSNPMPDARRGTTTVKVVDITRTDDISRTSRSGNDYVFERKTPQAPLTFKNLDSAYGDRLLALGHDLLVV